jgi:hypothetical protein
MKATEKSEPLLNVPVIIIGPRDAPRSWSGTVLPYTPPAQRRDRVQASKMGSGCGSSNRGGHLSSIIEIVVIVPRRRCSRTLQGRVIALFARGRALGRIAGDLGL